MRLSVTVDAVPFDLQTPDFAGASSSQVEMFSGAQALSRFVDKLVSQNLGARHHLQRILPFQTRSQPLVNALVDAVSQKKLLIIRSAWAVGAGASGPPAAQPRLLPAVADAVKADIKQFLPYRSQIVPAVKPSHKLCVEIAGRDLWRKQRLQVTTSQGNTLKQYPRNDHQRQHRSLCQFENLTNEPVRLAISVAMQGKAAGMSLPLLKQVSVYSKDLRKPLWDHLIVPIKPLVFLTQQRHKQQAAVFKQGWLYVFWQGKLWRELQADHQGLLRDVDLGFYRHQQTNQREAKGHCLDAVWVPWLLNNEAQQIQLLASSVQASWSRLQTLEGDDAARAKASIQLPEPTTYQSQQCFDEAAVDSGALLNAQLSDPREQRLIKAQSAQNIAAVYLLKEHARLALVLKQHCGEPLANLDVDILLGEQVIRTKTDAQGQLSCQVPADQQASELTIYRADQPEHLLGSFKLALNQLASLSTTKGVQARLNNLGFNAGSVDGVCGSKTRRAIRLFQSAENLLVDGVSGPKTRQALRRAHQS